MQIRSTCVFAGQRMEEDDLHTEWKTRADRVVKCQFLSRTLATFFVRSRREHKWCDNKWLQFISIFFLFFFHSKGFQLIDDDGDDGIEWKSQVAFFLFSPFVFGWQIKNAIYDFHTIHPWPTTTTGDNGKEALLHIQMRLMTLSSRYKSVESSTLISFNCK